MKKSEQIKNMSPIGKTIGKGFLLIMLAAFTFSLYTAYQVGSKNIIKEMSGLYSHNSSQQDSPAFNKDSLIPVLKKIQRRILVAALFFLLVIAFIWIVFIKNIGEPLKKMANAAKKIAKGRLSITLPDYTASEMGEIGEIINDFSINFQELLLHVWKYSTASGDLIENIHEKIRCGCSDSSTADIEEDIEHLRQNMENMQEMIRAFDYYDISFTDGKIMAKVPPGGQKDA